MEIVPKQKKEITETVLSVGNFLIQWVIVFNFTDIHSFSSPGVFRLRISNIQKYNGLRSDDLAVYIPNQFNVKGSEMRCCRVETRLSVVIHWLLE